jgi:hypothetical protein
VHVRYMRGTCVVQAKEHGAEMVAQSPWSGSVFGNLSLDLPIHADSVESQSVLYSACWLRSFPANASCNRVSTALTLAQ